MSLYDGNDEYLPDARKHGPRDGVFLDSNGKIPAKIEATWKKNAAPEIETKEDFEREFVRNAETTLARDVANTTLLAGYQASAYSVRDRLISGWNHTRQQHYERNPKRIYYFSLEFLMGRFMDNALLNMDRKDVAMHGLKDLGFNLEDILHKEPDAALGNGGLGRLAACFMDSIATLKLPGWGYGLRYQYGIFKQRIIDGYQVEIPDYWLRYTNPWEVPREDMLQPVRFYGDVKHSSKDKSQWTDGDVVEAIPYDIPLPGYGTENIDNLRLWASKPTRDFDFSKFNCGDYVGAMREQQEAETITAVLYPNDDFDAGKQLRLKQQHFWVSASAQDIVRRFKKKGEPFSEFSNKVAIQLNDTHPTLIIPELYRILLDEEGVPYEEAWDIVVNTVAYTNHTVLPEALEKWPVPVVTALLPRHMELIYDINQTFLNKVSEKFPDDMDLIRRVSLIEEGHTKYVRMAYLAIVGSHKVNGVAELHSDIIKKTIFKDFVTIYGSDKFINVTNGVTPRRWLNQANPTLSSLIEKKLGSKDFLKDLTKLKGLEKYAKDVEFQKEWAASKRFNKQRLGNFIKQTTGYELDVDALWDIQVKRIHEYKRQQLNIFGAIYRYLMLKEMSAEQLAKEQSRVTIIGGKSAPGYYMAKTIIKLINSVSKVVNEDKETNGKFKVIFIEEYNVSKAEIITPASDISEHISTAGTEASGTSNMKFVLNGGLILGTVDGANVEITREIGKENIFLFGNLSDKVDELRRENGAGLHRIPINEKLNKVFNAINSGLFGNFDIYKSLIDSITYPSSRRDYYLVNNDFQLYLNAQDDVSREFKLNKSKWVEKSILSVARSGFFSSDRAVMEYADKIWNVKPMDIFG